MSWGKASFDISTRFSCTIIIATKFLSQITTFNAESAPRLRISSFARRQSSNRYGENKVHRTDMMHSFIQHGMTPGEAERGGLLQLVAGSDTTATALRAAVLFVATSPVVLARMRIEMANAGISPQRDTKTIIASSKARSIPYLIAVIKEALRLHPPVVGALEKQAGKEGDTLLDGRRIPPGTKIQVSTWAILRDPEVYGVDADCFRPERWLEAGEESEQRRRMDRSTELVFSAGRFICMGRDIALTQLLKVVCEVSRFSFVPVLLCLLSALPMTRMPNSYPALLPL